MVRAARLSSRFRRRWHIPFTREPSGRAVLIWVVGSCSRPGWMEDYPNSLLVVDVLQMFHSSSKV